MEDILRDCIKRNIGLIVSPLDGITGKNIRGDNIRVWIENEAPAVKKQDGFFVFTNLKQSEFILNVEGSIYEKQEIKMDRRKTEEYSGKIMEIRMAPNRNYPLPPNLVLLGENGDIYTEREIMENPYRLIRSYESGEKEISFFHPKDVSMEGKSFLIKSINTDDAEIFKTGSRLEESGEWTYSLNEPLRASYERVESVIYSVYERR